MILQFAIDTPPLKDSLGICEAIREYVDIIELGEGIIQRESMTALTKLKELFPEKKVLADLKLMDEGYIAAVDAFGAGADIVTACIQADRGTCAGLVKAAKEMGKESWLGFIAIPPQDYAKYVDYVNELAPDYVCAHLGDDVYRWEDGRSARKEMFLAIAKLNFKPKVVLSGGITPDDIPDILACKPHHVNVGSYIGGADDPAAAAKIFKDA